MSIVKASITDGAYASSELVRVEAAVANGTSVLVCRGEFVLGTALITDYKASVAVPPLAAGDVIQASISERGNQCDIPVRVAVNPISATGWVKPDWLEFTNADGSTNTIQASAYESAYGETAGAVFDPVTAGATMLPEDYDKLPLTELGFDVEQILQAGSTTLRVVPRNSEGLLVGWNGATPSSPAPLTITESGYVTVEVERDDAPGISLERTLTIIVLPTPTYPSAPAPGDIISAGYRNYRSGYIQAHINCLKPCEAQLIGYDSSWQTAAVRDPDFQEVNWYPVPQGTYTCSIRVIGETDPDNYTNFIINVFY